MPRTVTNRVDKRSWGLLALSLVVALVGGVCVPGLAQSTAPKLNTQESGKAAPGWSSLPPDAQRAILAKLEEDNPVWTQQAELTASDGKAEDGFGAAVAVSGGTVVVGAPLHPYSPPNDGPGAAYVFVERGGTWIQQAELTASDGVSGDLFGYSVAMDGNTIVVGAPTHQIGSNRYPGAAYVFVESGGTWSQQAELTASDGASWDYFGISVAMSGSTVVLGAVYHKALGINEPGPGAAYVFIESGGSWTPQAELTAFDGFDDDLFGISVAVSGSVAFVGAPRHTFAINKVGVAYVFAENDGIWTQQAELSPSDRAEYEGFGAPVALDGGTAVVTGTSAVYVFEESGGVWNRQAELTASDGTADNGFGGSLAVSGSTVVAGAANQDVGSNQFQGAAYVFVQSGGVWSQQAELAASDGVKNDHFGASVAVSGSTVTTGASNRNVGSNYGQGAAYVFSSSAPGFTLSANPSSLSMQQGEQVTSAITITPANGFSGSVSLSASGLPNGVTATFNPNPATSTSTLTLTAGAMATTGTTTFAVTGASGSLTLTMNLTLTVTPSITAKLSSSSLNFGNEVIDTASASRTVTVTDTGNATLVFSSIAITGDFAISVNTCQFGIGAGTKCQVEVTFTPTQLGRLTGTLTFTDNAPNSPQTVTLSGTGVLPATLSPTSVTYPKQRVGTTSAAKTFTLSNNQLVALTSIAISATGDFAVSATTCGTSLAPKEKCTVSVTFTPTAAGTRTGQLGVSDSASNSPQTSNLTGTGK